MGGAKYFSASCLAGSVPSRGCCNGLARRRLGGCFSGRESPGRRRTTPTGRPWFARPSERQWRGSIPSPKLFMMPGLCAEDRLRPTRRIRPNRMRLLASAAPIALMSRVRFEPRSDLLNRSSSLLCLIPFHSLRGSFEPLSSLAPSPFCSDAWFSCPLTPPNPRQNPNLRLPPRRRRKRRDLLQRIR